MARNVQLLDCTLRDGGRIINCAFPQFHIDGIMRGLTDAGIDIIEMGFLRGNVEYKGNSTFFTNVEQAKKNIPEKKGRSMFVLFADYGEEYGGWDFTQLPECDGETITGIRLGFRKEDFKKARQTLRRIQEMGYKLFVQLIETRNYTDLEFLHTLEEVNSLSPHAVGIVDTFGRMYKEDLIHYYTLADHNLDEEIMIDFHTHNNMQLSFAFAQEIVSLSKGNRKVVLDATLYGMGKGAGNLNLELIVDYLNRQYNYDYNFDRILDTIDEHIQWIKNDHDWGYSLPSLMSALFSSHPNNVDYLLKKNRLQTKDIRYILTGIDANTRKRYDYDNLESVYLEYSSSKFDDAENIKRLRTILRGRPVLVVVFGATSRTRSREILRYIEEKKPVVISVNHIYKEYTPDYAFFGNNRRYNSINYNEGDVKYIVTSNIPCKNEGDIIVDYNKVISVGYSNYDNSTIMLLNLLRNVDVEDFAIAGLDGYTNGDKANYYSEEVFAHNAPREEYGDAHNAELKALLKHFSVSLTEKHSIRLLTPSMFEGIFEPHRKD